MYGIHEIKGADQSTLEPKFSRRLGRSRQVATSSNFIVAVLEPVALCRVDWQYGRSDLNMGVALNGAECDTYD